MIRKWVSKFGLPAYRTPGGLAITETDLREFSERLKVYVDWASVHSPRYAGVPTVNTRRRS